MNYNYTVSTVVVSASL